MTTFTSWLEPLPLVAILRGLRPNEAVAIGRALAVVPAVVQDPAAVRVVRFVDPPPGSTVADVCAAPGGKALALACGGEDGLRPKAVVAGDRSAIRTRRMVPAVARLRAPVWPVVMDARRPPLESADVVLIDAPCSGTGTLRHAGEEYPIRAGDFICSPADPEQPHQIINTSDDELTYIALSEQMTTDVIQYPDSGKYGVWHGDPSDMRSPSNFVVFARRETAVDYWDGEAED